MLQSFKDVQDARDLDPEAFYQLIVIARSIAVTRPQNIGKFTPETNLLEQSSQQQTTVKSGGGGGGGGGVTDKKLTEHSFELVRLMVDTMWRLHKARPKNPALTFIGVPGKKMEMLYECGKMLRFNFNFTCSFPPLSSKVYRIQRLRFSRWWR